MLVSRLLIFIIFLALLVIAVGSAGFAVMSYVTASRGIETAFPVTRKVVGTNVALDQYTDDAELQRAFDALRGAGLEYARQYFAWREIEPQRGVYDWAKSDRIVNAAQANGIRLIAVLTTAPAWSQRENERDMPNAPPADFAEFARFAGEFSQRYADRIQYYQIWDEPNVEPNWGKRNADPVEYAQLLTPAANAVRANDPDAVIVLAGLAMNLELHRPHPNYSEILFLRGLYEIGANKYWDIVAAKPYGMWTGPEDRTVNSGVLNFSRLILLRDEMRQYGEASKPVWAVEMGWNALPANWSGQASPWGTDAEATQADRLKRALARADDEWLWLTGEFPNVLQPNVAADDPRWGFALMTRDFQPRAFYETLAQSASRAQGILHVPAVPIIPVALLLGIALVSGWRAWHWALVLGLDERWRRLKARANALPEWAQGLVVAAAAVAFYVSPSVPLNFALMGLLIFLLALRLEWGIVLTIFVIPFWNFPKILFGGFELSPVESFTWMTTAAFLLDAMLTKRVLRLGDFVRMFVPGASTGRNVLSALQSIDLAVLVFLALGLLSTRWAGNFGVASREFRIVILDPILLYVLIRLTPGLFNRERAAEKRETARAVQIQGRLTSPILALLASGAAVSVIGLYQYVTGNVILADGVARLTAVWGSPNNVGLYLGRLLPIALTFALLLRDRQNAPRRGSVRLVYAGLVVLFAATIGLTLSRGALFLGVPASILFVLIVLFTQSHMFSRRVWLVIGAAVVVGALALVPFLFSERAQSWFQAGTGTAFFRVAVWTSAVNMIRDHPLLGVGLDNFLYEYPKYILPEAWREPNLSHPHNVVLDFWVRLGIGGLLVFVWMVAAFFNRAWNTFVTTKDVYTHALLLGLMASVVNMLAHGLIDAAYFVVDLAYVFMLTLAVAQGTGEQERQR